MDDGIIKKVYDYIESVALSYEEKIDVYKTDKDNINGPIEPKLLYFQVNSLKAKLEKINNVQIKYRGNKIKIIGTKSSIKNTKEEILLLFAEAKKVRKERGGSNPSFLLTDDSS